MKIQAVACSVVKWDQEEKKVHFYLILLKWNRLSIIFFFINFRSLDQLLTLMPHFLCCSYRQPYLWQDCIEQAQESTLSWQATLYEITNDAVLISYLTKSVNVKSRTDLNAWPSDLLHLVFRTKKIFFTVFSDSNLLKIMNLADKMASSCSQDVSRVYLHTSVQYPQCHELATFWLYLQSRSSCRFISSTSSLLLGGKDA